MPAASSLPPLVPSSSASGAAPHPAPAGRPRVALIHLVFTPYWIHLHKRLDAEIPEIELHSLYTHDVPDQPWKLDGNADVRPVNFGVGEAADSKTIFSSAKRELARAGRIIAWLKEHDVKFVVLYGYNDAGRVRILRWCRRAGIPCVLSSDSNLKMDRATGLKKIIKKLLVGFAVRSASGALPFGTAGANYFIKYGARPDRVFPFPVEPDYSIIDGVTPADVKAVCTRFNIPGGGGISSSIRRRRIVYCGRLIELKRIDTLIDAFNAIAAERPNWDLVLIGNGPLRDELGARVRPELRDRVIWTGFIGDAPTISAVYKACDIKVLPSRHEQWAIVVNEAVAAGLALITSEVVGASEDLLRAGKNGWSFPAGDVPALIKALLDVTDPAKIDQYKAGSVEVIADFKDRCDPVKGLRSALRVAGVIPK